MWGNASIKSDCSISEMSASSISNVVSGNTSTSLIRDREITNTPGTPGKKPLRMAAKQTIGMNGMADVFVGSDTHLGLVEYGERQSAEITKERGFLVRLR